MFTVSDAARRHMQLGADSTRLQIKAGASEGVFLNCRPHGIGGTFVKSDEVDEDGREQWESVLKQAKGRMSTAKGRMGKE